MINVLIFNEFSHEKQWEALRKPYPQYLHGALKAAVECEDVKVKCVTLEDPDCGINDEVLKETDVLIWWGHVLHRLVPDHVVDCIQRAVLNGMGFIALHSAHVSKPFTRLMGTSCTLKWRDNDRERVWVTSPAHPIAAGLPEYFELPQEEMYGEYFDIPTPDEVVFMGWFAGGELFRSGCTWHRGLGKIFYFQPGHEEFPIYYNEYVVKILQNAVRWAAPTKRIDGFICPNAPLLEKKAD